ncbi:hypothetical protein [Frondihabitans australicus]|uniref:Uncharacterized protein n=1 Tax=Frondihabitans australicus TaxID=386892 RepID=A0A495IFK0_9MICO|nr:hypothetical protein [Frondihabitans australicus]RKR74714.1 hypothetical protein C8E83_1842 [Frondihabitans australicus]
MSSRSVAYEVPLWIDREGAPRVYRVCNLGDEPIRGLRATLLGPGHLEPVHVPVLTSGGDVSLTVVGPDLERGSVAVLRWFRPDGTEYLWRFSF